MFKFYLFLLFTFTTSLWGQLEKVPVCYEGRCRPFGTLPESLQKIHALPVLPMRAAKWEEQAGCWLPLSAIYNEENTTVYSDHFLESLRNASGEKELAALLFSEYRSIAGTVYKETASGKTLRYPTTRQLALELYLHRLPLKWVIFSAYLFAALLLALRRKKTGLGFLLTAFFIHTCLLAVRCYLLGRPPVSNMDETLLFAPWAGVLIGFVFYKSKYVLICSALSAAALALFLPARLDLEPAQAVLNSQYWLIIHVMMVVGSYGVFLLAGGLGHLFLLQKSPSPQFEKILLRTMYLGTALLILGTILGGVWAAQSWGRFWDWDPKESWAFISSGLYLAWIHAYKFKKIGGNGLALGAIIGLMAITFTWYGVNYILGTGLHSYGFGQGGQFFYYLYLILEIAFLSMAPRLKNILYKNWKIAKKERRR